MKMKLGIVSCYLFFMLINHRSSNLLVSAKSLETQNVASCQHSVDFFKSFLNVTIQTSNKAGECYDHAFDAFLSLITKINVTMCYREHLSPSVFHVFTYHTGNPS